jgi:predicted amidophosphoribosyltransferase
MRRRPGLATTFVVPLSGPIFREVTSAGVRVYSLCAGCGARLESSATLCGACAKRRSPSSPS